MSNTSNYIDAFINEDDDIVLKIGVEHPDDDEKLTIQAIVIASSDLKQVSSLLLEIHQSRDN